MNFSARITGLDHVMLGIRSLGDRLPDVVNSDVRDAMEKAAKMSVPYVGGADYAVPLTDSGRNYRTGNLGRSVQVYQRGVSTVIEAAAYRRGREYTTYVIGDRNGGGQAAIHQGRWMTMFDAVTYQLDELVKTVDEDIQKTANQLIET